MPLGWWRMSLRNGKVPSREVVEAAVQDYYAKMRTKFGEAALDLNGRLIGSLAEEHSRALRASYGRDARCKIASAWSIQVRSQTFGDCVCLSS